MGLALGTTVTPELQLIAIDVDSEEMVERVKRAIDGEPPAKVGKKGITYLVLAPQSLHSQKVTNRSVQEGRKTAMAVEFLAGGSQTVLPPSIHPDGMTYRWLTKPLQEYEITELPVITNGAIDEITAHAHGKGELFDALNTMIWNGEGGGGNTHDTCVAAVACMVARQWVDGDIVTRIERAKREAVERVGERYHWPDSERRIREWIESAREKGMDVTSKARKVPVERAVADAMIYEFNEQQVKIVTYQGQTLIYQDGYWVSIVEDELLRMVLLRDQSLTMSQTSAAARIFQIKTRVEAFGAHSHNRICLINGTYNLNTQTLELHSAEHEIRHQLPFDWDDGATCPIYDTAVERIFQGDAESAQLWNEYCSHTLVPDMTLQKVLFLVGPGGSGKSTLSAALRAMHDPRAVSSIPITALHDERMRTALVGKLVNISAEQSRINPIADDYLKKITGGDGVDVRFLYKEPVNAQLTVRFIELANEMPATRDVSDAIKRRLLILACPKPVTDPDRFMVQKLQSERPGVLRKWAAAFRTLQERKEFCVPENSKFEVSAYLLENDPIALWLDDQCDKTSGTTDNVTLYTAYRFWAESFGYVHRDIFHMSQWGRRLTSLGIPSVLMQGAGGTRVRARHLKLKKGLHSHV